MYIWGGRKECGGWDETKGAEDATQEGKADKSVAYLYPPDGLMTSIF